MLLLLLLLLMMRQWQRLLLLLLCVCAVPKALVRLLQPGQPLQQDLERLRLLLLLKMGMRMVVLTTRELLLCRLRYILLPQQPPALGRHPLLLPMQLLLLLLLYQQ